MEKCGWRPHIVPADHSIRGHSYAEWSTAFWQWLWSIPADQHPGLDTTGEFVATNQSGNVWFLAANFGGISERTATIPPGKKLFINVAAWFFAPAIGDEGGEAELRAAAAAAVEATENIWMKIDGELVEDLDLFRFQSPELFGYDTPAGDYYPAVSDGYFVALRPMRRGEHTIQIHAEFPDPFGESDITFYLTVGR